MNIVRGNYYKKNYFMTLQRRKLFRTTILSSFGEHYQSKQVNNYQKWLLIFWFWLEKKKQNLYVFVVCTF